MATCLCDAFFDDVARATVEVLEHLGYEIDFPERQTCCSQPAFNAGDWPAAQQVARHVLDVFAAPHPVVVPSVSCAQMTSHGSLLLFEKDPRGDLRRVKELARRTFELCDFIFREHGLRAWPGRFSARIALHQSCHGRGTGSPAAAAALLGSIDGVKLLEIGEAEQCCGFGGTFSVAFPHVSRAMGDLKIEHVLATEPEVLVSADMSCLMHLQGLAARAGRPLRTLHVAQVLRDALRARHA